MASFGQSISQARQYQHSSNAMWAFPVSGFTARQSTGQESMQMRHLVMHRFTSTTTGTSNTRVVRALPTTAAWAAFTLSRSLSSLIALSSQPAREAYSWSSTAAARPEPDVDADVSGREPDVDADVSVREPDVDADAPACAPDATGAMRCPWYPRSS